MLQLTVGIYLTPNDEMKLFTSKVQNGSEYHEGNNKQQTMTPAQNCKNWINPKVGMKCNEKYPAEYERGNKSNLVNILNIDHKKF